MVIEGNFMSVHDKYMAISRNLNVSSDKLFSKDTEFGKWLRTKNAVVKINDRLFVHGGISPEIISRILLYLPII